MVMMLMVMVVAAAIAVLIVMVMMLMVMVVATAIAMLIVMVMMLMVMVMATAIAVLIVMMQALLLQASQLSSQRCLALHCLQQLLAAEILPGSGNDGSDLVQLTDQLHSLVQLGSGDGAGTRKDDGGSGLDLVVVELTKVLTIDLDLVGIGNGNRITQLDLSAGDLIHRTDHIGKLANTGRLNDHAVRIVLSDDLLQRLAKVAHQAAANAAGVHFGNVDTGLLQEAAVNADLAKLIFDEHQFLTLVALGDHLLDEGSLTGTQKTGINIDFCHNNAPSIV